jgi:hypothetical protein
MSLKVAAERQSLAARWNEAAIDRNEVVSHLHHKNGLIQRVG